MQFLDGNVYHQTLAYFRDFEDAEAESVVGDQLESTRLYRPADGLRVNNLTEGISFDLQAGFESRVKAGEIYIFCCSSVLKDSLVKKFKAEACVEIQNPDIFIKRWKAALPHDAKHFNKKVDYYKPSRGPGNTWPQPHLIATGKPELYAYQKEYRFGFSITDALEFGQATQELVDRKGRPKPNPAEHHQWTLEQGSLRDICKLHRW